MQAIRNLEIKAQVSGKLNKLRECLQALGAHYEWTRQQTDTFFATPQGRLKLREERDQNGVKEAELIPYFRPDTIGPRESRFVILNVSQPELTRDLLTQMLGVTVTVCKTRELWLLHDDTVRVHLDQVEDLGEFLEIEAILETENILAINSDDLSSFTQVQTGRLKELLIALGVSNQDQVAVAYADLLLKRNSNT